MQFSQAMANVGGWMCRHLRRVDGNSVSEYEAPATQILGTWHAHSVRSSGLTVGIRGPHSVGHSLARLYLCVRILRRGSRQLRDALPRSACYQILTPLNHNLFRISPVDFPAKLDSALS